MCERTKGSKLEGQYKRKVGKLLKVTAHNITFLPKNSNKEVVLSKRDVAKDTTERVVTSKQFEIPQTSTEEETSDDETYVMPEYEEDEETTSTSKSASYSRNEEDICRETDDMGEKPKEQEASNANKKAVSEKMATPKKMDNSKEKVDNDRETEKKKAIKASVEWTPASEREPQRADQHNVMELTLFKVKENEQIEQQE